jgi:SPP1 family predicted phage head-tail adaptor
VRAGTLRHKIEIQEDEGTTRDAAGVVTPSWVTVNGGERWAGVKPISGNESEIGGKQTARRSHEVTIRYLSGVTSKMRVKYGSRYLYIESVLNVDERNREMTLLCVEKP